jgi:hypothetical protein
MLMSLLLLLLLLLLLGRLWRRRHPTERLGRKPVWKVSKGAILVHRAMVIGALAVGTYACPTIVAVAERRGHGRLVAHGRGTADTVIHLFCYTTLVRASLGAELGEERPPSQTVVGVWFQNLSLLKEARKRARGGFS